jgi:two-component system phosphate regulon sensor histidine kinase PhoR
MRHRILFRLLIAYLAVVCACVLLVGFPLHFVFQRDYVTNAASAFEEQVTRLAPELTTAIEGGDRPQLDALCARLNERFKGRVTVLSPGGETLGESMGALCIEEANPECVDMIRSGLRGEEAGAAPLARTMILNAPVRPGRPNSAVMRLALPLDPMYEQLRTVHLLLLAGAIGAGGLAVAIGFMLSHGIARPLSQMTRVAENIAAGDFQSPVSVRGRGEIGRLADAINVMRSSLSASVRTLADERNQILAIVENMSEGVLVLGPDGKVELFNRAIEEMVPLAGRLRSGATLEELGADPRLVNCAREARETGQLAMTELGSLEAGEQVIAVVASQVSEDNLSAEGHGTVLVAHDITGARRIESMGRELVANASHELRTPLAAISSTAETLLNRGTPRDREGREFLEVIVRQAERLRRTIANTLELSRIDALAGSLKAEPLDVAYLVEEVAETFAGEVKSKEQRLEISAPADLPPVEGDGNMVSLALRNLVANAVRYTPAGGRIWVRALRDDGHVMFEVEDTGPGIPAEDRPRVFDRFFRGRNAVEAAEEGAGLGLSIVKRVAQAHGGGVTLRTPEGSGSVFALRLPASQTKPVEQAAGVGNRS